MCPASPLFIFITACWQSIAQVWPELRQIAEGVWKITLCKRKIIRWWASQDQICLSASKKKWKCNLTFNKVSFFLQLRIESVTKLAINVQVMLQPLKEKKHSLSEIFPIPLICAVCLIAPALPYPRRAMFSQRGVLGRLFAAPSMTRWIGQRPHLLLISPSPRLEDVCGHTAWKEGRTPAYGCQWFTHSLATEHSNLFQAKKLLMDYSKPSRTYCCVCGQHGHKAFLFRQKTFDSEQFQDLYFCKAPNAL